MSQDNKGMTKDGRSGREDEAFVAMTSREPGHVKGHEGTERPVA